MRRYTDEQSADSLAGNVLEATRQLAHNQHEKQEERTIDERQGGRARSQDSCRHSEKWQRMIWRSGYYLDVSLYAENGSFLLKLLETYSGGCKAEQCMACAGVRWAAQGWFIVR